MASERVAVYMHSRGLLTTEQAEQAFLYTSDVDVASDQRTLNIAGLTGDVSLSFQDCMRFAEWVLVTHIHKTADPNIGHKLVCFIMMIVHQLAHGAARFLNQRTPSEFRRRGYRYFHDACFTSCVDMLFGGAHIQFVRITKFEEWGTIGLRKGGKIWHARVVQIDGFRVVMSAAQQIIFEAYENQFMCIVELRQRPGYYKVRGKTRPRSYLLGIAMRVTRNNFVALEVGPVERLEGGKKIVRLSHDHHNDRALQSSGNITGVDLKAMLEVFVATSDILKIDADILTAEFYKKPTDGMDSHKWFEQHSGQNIARTTYYRKLDSVQEKFAEFIRGHIG